jgi:NADPH2:quinone reductase
MKVIRVHEFGKPEVMRTEEGEDPKPGAGQVVVQVRAAGVNPVDTYIRSGLYPAGPKLPYTPGSDGAGIVESIGEDVHTVSVGDRVYLAGTITGSYAQKALCRDSQVCHLPEKISFAQGAAINVPYATAYRALFQRARAIPGEILLVHGASGGVGIASVQLAHALGMKIIGTAGTEQGRNLILEQGAHHVVDHHDPKHIEQVMQLTGSRGIDVILEMLANINLGKDLGILAVGGRVAVIGSRGKVEIDARDAMGRESEILGVMLAHASECEISSIHAALAAGLENGTLHPVVGREFPLEEAPRAHHEIMESHAYGKIVLIP